MGDEEPPSGGTAAPAAEDDDRFAKWAWFCLHRDQSPRRECIKIVTQPWFDHSILILILLNSVTMTLFANPVLTKILLYSNKNASSPDYYTASSWAAERWDLGLLRKDHCAWGEDTCSVADWIDFAFLLIFATEMVLKMTALGLCGHKSSYLASGWNWIDMLVVLTGFVTLVFSAFPVVGTFRLVRMIRPLRSIQRIRGLRVLVQCIIVALPQICNVGIFLVFILTIFALFGVAFFGLQMRHSCHQWVDDAWVSTGEMCDPACKWNMDLMVSSGCESLGHDTIGNYSFPFDWRWSYTCRPGFQCRCTESHRSSAACTFKDNPNYGATSFDSYPWAMVTLFTAITLEGWTDVMYYLMDGCSVFVIPYFIILVFFGAIIVINLFLAVLWQEYDTADSAVEDNGKEDAKAKALRYLNGVASTQHDNAIRQRCLELVRWKPFDWFIQACIVLNTLIMCFNVAPMPYAFIPTAGHPFAIDLENEHTDYLPMGHFLFLYVSNIVLTIIFTAESVVKIIGLGPRLFWMEFMNRFDVAVVIVSLAEIVVDVISRTTNSGFEIPIPLSVLRAFRSLRLFKLVRSVKSMRKVLATLAQSFDSVIYLGLLLCLMILIFILLGMELFGGYYPRPELSYTNATFPSVWRDAVITWPDDRPASRYHFDDFGTALLSIFVVLSGENWNEIMWDSHRATWDHDLSTPLRFPWAIPYFILLFVLGNLLLFNLFIAILLSNFDDDEEAAEEIEAEEAEVADVAVVEAVSEATERSGAASVTFERSEKPELEVSTTAERTGAASAGRKLDKKKGSARMLTYEFGAYRDPTDPTGEKASRKKGHHAAHVSSGGFAASPSEAGSASAYGDDSSAYAESPMPATPESSQSEGGENALPPFPLVESEMGANIPMVVSPVLPCSPRPIFTWQVPTREGGDRSLGIFSWHNPVRKACARVVLHPYFEGVILVLILASTLALMFDFPHLPRTHPLRGVLQGLNYFFTFSFLSEAIAKVIVHGLLFSKTPPKYEKVATAYLCDPWNRLDGLIVGVSIIILFNIPGIDGLRAFRALRPLRLVSRYEDLKLTVDTLLLSIPAMGSLFSVAMLFFTIFGILGLELFGGRFGYCMDPLYADEPYGSRVIPGLKGNQTDYEECMSLSRYNLTRRTTDGILLTDMADADPEGPWLNFVEFPQWMYPQFGTFDHFGYSLMMLFEISALEGWPDVLHWSMDADSEMLVVPWPVPSWMDNGMGGVGTPMQRHRTMPFEASAFFILWIILGCFVVVNLTISIVCDTFSTIKAQNDGVLLMTPAASEWVRTQKQAIALRPLVVAHPPKEPFRLKVYQIVVSTKFEVGIIVVILLNMLQMAIDWSEPAVNSPFMPDLKRAMLIINIIFLAIYTVEMLAKWVGLGLYQYYTDPWNVFDCVLVAASFFDVISSFLSDTVFPFSLIRVLRLFRVARILRLVKSAKNMRTIMMTVYISVPQLKNIGLLILLIIVITDLVCMNIFSFVNYTPGNLDFAATHLTSRARGEVYNSADFHWSDDGTNWGDNINRNANFQFFPTGLLVLLRCTTGESFNGIMHDLFSWEWGHNRLTCCPQCGPILDDGLTAPHTFTVPSTGEVISERVMPLDSCGNSVVAFLVYFLFQSIMAYTVFSIMIGVILENFSNADPRDQKIAFDDIETFREVWLKYDPQGTFSTDSFNIMAIMSQLPRPLGVKDANPPLTRPELLMKLKKLNLPDHNGKIHFNETLTHLAAFVGEVVVAVPDCEVVHKVQKMQAAVPEIKKLGVADHNTYTNYVLGLLQARFRAYESRNRARKNVKLATSALLRLSAKKLGSPAQDPGSSPRSRTSSAHYMPDAHPNAPLVAALVAGPECVPAATVRGTVGVRPIDAPLGSPMSSPRTRASDSATPATPGAVSRSASSKPLSPPASNTGSKLTL